MAEVVAYMGRDGVLVERSIADALLAWLEAAGEGAVYVCRRPPTFVAWDDQHGHMVMGSIRGSMFNGRGIEVSPPFGRKAEGAQADQVGEGAPYCESQGPAFVAPRREFGHV